MTSFPKGPTRKVRYEVKRQHKADIIRAVRVEVMQRDAGCRVCGSTRDAEMHEIVPRSILRGRAPEAIYTTHNCLRLCGGPKGCHAKVTAHEIRILITDPLRGADGPLRFTRVIRRPHVPTPTTD